MQLPPVTEGDLYREFGRRVATRRTELRLTQAGLAAAVRFSRASIANIEAGRQKLPLHQVYRLLAALKLDDPSVLLPAPPRIEVREASRPTITVRGDTDLSESALAQIEAIYGEYETGQV